LTWRDEISIEKNLAFKGVKARIARSALKNQKALDKWVARCTRDIKQEERDINRTIAWMESYSKNLKTQ